MLLPLSSDDHISTKRSCVKDALPRSIQYSSSTEGALITSRMPRTCVSLAATVFSCFVVWLRWVTNDIAEFRTASRSAGIGLPDVISRLMKSCASMTEGDWGTPVDLGGDGVKCVWSPRPCTLCGVAAASAPLLRFDVLRPARAVRMHCILQSTQFPQGSSRSHLTW